MERGFRNVVEEVQVFRLACFVWSVFSDHHPFFRRAVCFVVKEILKRGK